MKTSLLLLLGIYVIMTAIFFGYDVLVALYERYSHFHIGRWKDTHRWRDAVSRVCLRWVQNTPTLRLKKDCRYLILDRIRGTYGKTMVQSWQKAGCLLGLEEAGLAQKILPIIKKQVLDSNGNWKKKPKKIDYAMMAYALLKDEEMPEKIRPAMDEMISCIEDNLCDDGLVSYSGGKKSKRRYVDTLGFICPFLGLYGKVYKKQEYINMSVSQIRIFSEKGIYRGLPVHCYDAESGYPLGIIGWGRGTGWYVLALTDLYSSIDNSKDKAMLEKKMKEVADTILGLESENGGFSSILVADGPYDSSATAMIGYFLAQSGRLFQNSSYFEAAVRCEKRLMKETKINGVIDNCQGDTIDIGIFSERYAEMPFAQGMALRLVESIMR